MAQPAEALSIYAVDDYPGLTELYAGLLEAVGYVVRTFILRADALAALKTDHHKPALLITDYRGLSIPVDQFIHACRSVHPSLRILMASGCDEHEMQFCRVRPDRFIQKPFTPEELQQTVRAVLAYP
jgi:DNA-binding NtrC family response regulator